MKKFRKSVRVDILRGERTEEMKAVRRMYGDVGGHCHFAARQWLPSPHPYANALTGVQKDNMLLLEYDL